MAIILEKKSTKNELENKKNWEFIKTKKNNKMTTNEFLQIDIQKKIFFLEKEEQNLQHIDFNLLMQTEKSEYNFCLKMDFDGSFYALELDANIVYDIVKNKLAKVREDLRVLRIYLKIIAENLS